MSAPPPIEPSLPTRAQFQHLATLFEARTGIKLAEDKVSMVAGRLQSRLRAKGLESFDAYLALLDVDHEKEVLWVVEALTTHETSFFREARHFDVLRAHARAHTGPSVYRVWSAACSSGEEACSIAMTLADLPELVWEVVGTDIGVETVRRAREGRYTLVRGETIPPRLKKAYCLRGTDEFDGQFCLREALQARLRFEVANLLDAQGSLGEFNFALLRNVLIYFDAARQQRIVNNVVSQLRPGGLLVVGHAERITPTSQLEHIDSSVYRRVTP